MGATSPGGPSSHSSENLGSSSLGGGNSTHHPTGGANTHLTDNNVTSPHNSSPHTHDGTGHTSGSSGAGSTGSPGSSTHPGGTSSGSTTPTTGPGHTGGNTNPTSGANTPTHTDGSHAAMTADNAPSTNNSTTHTGNTTTPDGPPGHTTGEPTTPKRALDDDPTTRPTDPVTAEPRHADEPPETSSGGGGDDGNNHGGGGDDGNNHGDDGDNHGDDGNNHGDDGDNHNNHGDGGDDHNNHHGSGDDIDPEVERLRSQPPETIDDALKLIREPKPYNGTDADIGKAMDDSTRLVDNPKEIFGTTDGKPNSYNDWAKEYLDEKGKSKWPDPEHLPVENGLDKTKGIERYNSIDDYISNHGNRVDRVGGPFGSFLGGIDDGRVATFGERAISPESVKQPYYQYEFTGNLPEGYRIDRGIVYPWHGAPGGASQVQIFDPSKGRALSVSELLNEGILRGATDFVGLS